MAGFEHNFISVVLFISLMLFEVLSDNSCDIDIEKTLDTLLNTQENPSMQVRALQLELLKKLQEASEKQEEDDNKRALVALAKYNDLPEHKRNLEALARAGYIKTIPDEEDADANYKRSIANLAKNGQLPIRKEDRKRGIESLARNGGLHQNREILDPLQDVYLMRSLVKNYNLPYSTKRSLSSLAKAGDLYSRQSTAKRNIAALAREGMIPGKRYSQSYYFDGSPKDIVERPSNELNMRSQGEANDYYEKWQYPMSNDRNNIDYNVIQNSNAARTHSDYEKRFLGSVAKTGWFRSSSTPSKYSHYFRTEKRHIGSLARLGWLPTLRQIRRFNRSGRSTSADNSCRTFTSDGKTKINSNPQHPLISLIDGRNRNQSKESKVSLRTAFYHPRFH